MNLDSYMTPHNKNDLMSILVWRGAKKNKIPMAVE